MKPFRLARAWACVLVLAATACALPSASPRLEAPHEVHVTLRGPAPVALVLSGGSARGLAHIGVLKVLEENGLEPDLVVGSSAGAMIGALYASGLSASQIEQSLAGLDLSDLAKPVWPRMGAMPGALGFMSSEKLRRYMLATLPQPLIEDFPRPFAAVATDLDAGDTARFNAGSAALAVEASTAIPVIVAPVEFGGHRYIDGQVTAPVPVQAARDLGAARVIAVDVIYPPDESSVTSPLKVLFQAFLSGIYRLREMQLKDADLVITPRIPATSGQLGLGDRETLVAAGEAAAREALPRLRTMMHARTPAAGPSR